MKIITLMLVGFFMQQELSALNDNIGNDEIYGLNRDLTKIDYSDMNKFPYRLVDLTHTLNSNTRSWDGSCGFNHVISMDYNEQKGDARFRVQNVEMHAGIGTHMDAPSHCIPEGKTIDLIPLDSLLAPMVVIDIAKKVTDDYKLTVQDILDFENQYGKIEEDSFVAIYTGWSKYWDTPRYHNNYIFPSVSAEAANLLISRKIMGLGVDTLSPDINDSGYPVHKIMLGNDKYIVENIANLTEMPNVGAFILSLPIKGSGLTESPVRMVGLVKDDYLVCDKIK